MLGRFASGRHPDHFLSRLAKEKKGATSAFVIPQWVSRIMSSAAAPTFTNRNRHAPGYY